MLSNTCLNFGLSVGVFDLKGADLFEAFGFVKKVYRHQYDHAGVFFTVLTVRLGGHKILGFVFNIEHWSFLEHAHAGPETVIV